MVCAVFWLCPYIYFITIFNTKYLNVVVFSALSIVNLSNMNQALGMFNVYVTRGMVLLILSCSDSKT